MKLPATITMYRTLADLVVYLRSLVASIATGWNVEHSPDGTHADVTVDSLTWGAEIDAGDAILTPEQLTANTDNYNPAGWQAAHKVRLSASGAINLTGWIAPFTTVTARTLELINVGTQNITLVNASASSVAANRFAPPGAANLVLNANDSIRIWYDPTSLVWRVLGV